jgi:hypothetical protein
MGQEVSYYQVFALLRRRDPISTEQKLVVTHSPEKQSLCWSCIRLAYITLRKLPLRFRCMQLLTRENKKASIKSNRSIMRLCIKNCDATSNGSSLARANSSWLLVPAGPGCHCNGNRNKWKRLNSTSLENKLARMVE